MGAGTLTQRIELLPRCFLSSSPRLVVAVGGVALPPLAVCITLCSLSMLYNVLQLTIRALRVAGLVSVATGLLRWAQPMLQRRVLHILDRLPPTGLFDPPDDVVFSEYCRHVLRTLESSPRTEYLRSAQTELAAACERDPEMHWLSVELLQLGAEPQLLQLCEALERLSPGRLYLEWHGHRTYADAQRFSDHVLDEIRVGMRRKASRTGTPRSEHDIEDGVQRIIESDAAKRAHRARLADAMWPRVEADPDYQQYQRALGAFEASGAAELQRRYREMDQNVGHGRRSRGSAFEERAHTAFLLLEPRLRQRLRETNRHHHDHHHHHHQVESTIIEAPQNNTDEEQQIDPNLHYVTGSTWIDEAGNMVGELDVVFLNGDEVIGIVEFKSNCYEIAAAERQHLVKMQGRHSIRTDDGRRLRLTERPLFFVATLIPGHEYLLGAEAQVVAAITDALFGEQIDINDHERMAQLAHRIRDDLALTESPQDYMRRNPDHVLVLL